MWLTMCSNYMDNEDFGLQLEDPLFQWKTTNICVFFTNLANLDKVSLLTWPNIRAMCWNNPIWFCGNKIENIRHISCCLCHSHYIRMIWNHHSYLEYGLFHCQYLTRRGMCLTWYSWKCHSCCFLEYKEGWLELVFGGSFCQLH